MSERKWKKEIEAWLAGSALEYLVIPHGWITMDISKNYKDPISSSEFQWRIKPVNPKDLATGNYLAVNEVFSVPQVRNAFRAGWDKAIESIT